MTRVFVPKSVLYRLLGICKGDYLMTTELCRQELIGIAPNEIVRHGRWHSVFCDLAERKKDAIRRWRNDKERAKNECLCLAEEEDRDLRQEDREKKQKDHESRLRREVQRQLVQSWQAEKAEGSGKEEKGGAKKDGDSERGRKKDTGGAARKKEKRPCLQGTQEGMTSVHEKSQPAVAFEQEAERRAAEMIQRRQKTQHVHTHFSAEAKRERVKQRNRQILDRRLVRRRERQMTELRRRERIDRLRQQVIISLFPAKYVSASPKVVVEAVRDPARLVQSTDASRRRCDATSNPSSPSKPCTSAFIRHVPHKAVPSWRRATVPASS